MQRSSVHGSPSSTGAQVPPPELVDPELPPPLPEVADVELAALELADCAPPAPAVVEPELPALELVDCAPPAPDVADVELAVLELAALELVDSAPPAPDVADAELAALELVDSVPPAPDIADVELAALAVVDSAPPALDVVEPALAPLAVVDAAPPPEVVDAEPPPSAQLVVSASSAIASADARPIEARTVRVSAKDREVDAWSMRARSRRSAGVGPRDEAGAGCAKAGRGRRGAVMVESLAANRDIFDE
jgi:hypothetical protein